MTDAETPVRKKPMDEKTMGIYFILLLFSLALSIAGYALLDFWDGTIALIVAIVIIATIGFDRKIVHIPPTILIFCVIGLFLSITGQIIDGRGIVSAISYGLLGIILSLIGFVIAYVLMGRMPGDANEKVALVGLEAFSFGVCSYSLLTLASKYLSSWMSTVPDYSEMFDNLLYVTIGCAIICLFFLLERNTVFKYTVFDFLFVNSETLGIDYENDRRRILQIISDGESINVEFKSTLRTNLQTGEKDKRMEKAVLKTIVAFLNTEGGDLLVGVDDSGEITGIDLSSFDNMDKMNLHMSNLLSSQIGDGFNPYISFKTVPFDDVAVMIVTCKKSPIPAFLIEGKNETYFIRSGPSSVELSGSDMVRYIGAKQKFKAYEKKILDFDE